MHDIVRNGRGSKDGRSFGNTSVPRALVRAMIAWSQKRVIDFILMSQWFVKAVVRYGRRRSQDTTLSEPAHVGIVGVAVVVRSFTMVAVGVVVVADMSNRVAGPVTVSGALRVGADRLRRRSDSRHGS